MNDIELNNIDTSNRYIRTYIFAMLVIALCLLIKKVIDDYRDNKNTKSFNVFIAVIIIACGLFFSKTTVNGLGLESNKNFRSELISMNSSQTKASLVKIEKYSGGTFKRPSKVLVSATSDKERHYLQYNALPNRITLMILDSTLTDDKACDVLRSNDYFIVGYDYPKVDNWSIIKNCLVEDITPSLNSVYKTSVIDNKVLLEKIY